MNKVFRHFCRTWLITWLKNWYNFRYFPFNRKYFGLLGLNLKYVPAAFEISHDTSWKSTVKLNLVFNISAKSKSFTNLYIITYYFYWQTFAVFTIQLHFCMLCVVLTYLGIMKQSHRTRCQISFKFLLIFQLCVVFCFLLYSAQKYSVCS